MPSRRGFLASWRELQFRTRVVNGVECMRIGGRVLGPGIDLLMDYAMQIAVYHQMDVETADPSWSTSSKSGVSSSTS
jgi:hypothetical protein